MKAVYFQTAGALAVTFAIAACVAGPDLPPPIVSPAPPPVEEPAATEPPEPEPVAIATVQEPVYANYLDAPQTVGNWTYIADSNGGQAAFELSPSNETVFALTCFKGSGQIGLMRMISGPVGPAMRIKTETTEKSIPANPIDTQSNVLMAVVNASDPILDAMAITKGRFVVSVEGSRTLYLPAWAEVTRVIEDCR